MILILKTILPVFGTIFIGSVYGKFFKLNLEHISNLLLYLTIPCLMFYSISSQKFEPGPALIIMSAALFVILSITVLIYIFSKLKRFNLKEFNPRDFYIPVAFMNTGNMGIPLAYFAFGQQGLNRAVYFYLFTALLTFSLGTFLINKKLNIKNIFSLPALYAGISGIIFSLYKKQIISIISRWNIILTISTGIINIVKMISQITIPLMLLTLGYTLLSVNTRDIKYGISAAISRVVLGFFISLAFVNLFNIQGVTAKVIIIISANPSPVVSLVLANRFKANIKIASASILLSVLISLFTIPLILYYLTTRF